MKKQIPILSVLNRDKKFTYIKETLNAGNGAMSVFGLTQTHKIHVLSALISDIPNSMLIVLPTDADCVKYEEQFSAYGIETLHFPAKTQLLGASAIAVSGGTEARRTELLVELLHGEKNVVLVSCECLMQKLPPAHALHESVIKLDAGNEYDMQSTIKKFADAGYEHCEICDSKGSYSVRGGRIDIFPSNSQYPIRIEFFGDEIDTMRSYDPDNQRSIDNLDSFTIYPATEVPITAEQKQTLISKLKRLKGTKDIAQAIEDGIDSYRISQMLSLIYNDSSYIFDYMPKDTVIVLDEPQRLMETFDNEYNFFSENVRTVIENGDGGNYLWDLMEKPQTVIQALPQENMLMLFNFTCAFTLVAPKAITQMDVASATLYLNDEKAFLHDVKLYIQNNYAVVLFAGKNSEYLHSFLIENGLVSHCYDKLTDEDCIKRGEVAVIEQSMPVGFEYREIGLAVITENELYGLSMHRKQAYTANRAQKKEASKLLLSKLSVGDYVVHEAHGIARFMGVQEMEVDGQKRDFIALHFLGTDRMYIACDQLDKIRKYNCSSEKPPKLSKLGSNEWKNTVSRVTKSVKELALNLVNLYGERMKRTGFAFSPDTQEQKQLESAFPYDETPDQLTSIEEIKRDMESTKIMDRLICGDVGFGKTEVALRAAFKAVMDCKQAAFLVPTTILAHQHYTTLSTRFERFGLRVEVLSRFKTKKETEEILQRLKDGSIDVIVGTHRLLSKDVKFADLGLLVIDEEQRFGVGHKETIKELKKNVDVLTLTATPIPRTMHMSLIGIRDISLLDTPPKQRYPVQTFVTEYSDALIRDAISKELGRGGQVYFLYNDVKNMDSFYARLCKIVPSARISYAHGQMPEEMLENTMLDFIDGKFDVLLSSTIIENGLDVPNANTIIIYEADKLGLAQLYQLRGRVGRSKRIGFAYLTFQKNKVLSEVSEKRLNAISQFTQLGSGYKIAMRDLQIRGAGDLLGPQQHGNMEAIGYDLYCKIVSEAVAEAKGAHIAQTVTETAIDAPIDAYIPKMYVGNEEWRLQMYKRIAGITTYEDYLDVQDEFIDRFGDMPKQVENLMNIAIARAFASKCYITRIAVTAKETVFYFTNDAPYDITKFIEYVNRIAAKFSNDGGMILRIPNKNTDKSKVCAGLVRILQNLSECLEERT